jgi:hypothetical protein
VLVDYQELAWQAARGHLDPARHSVNRTERHDNRRWYYQQQKPAEYATQSRPDAGNLRDYTAGAAKPGHDHERYRGKEKCLSISNSDVEKADHKAKNDQQRNEPRIQPSKDGRDKRHDHTDDESPASDLLQHGFLLFQLLARICIAVVATPGEPPPLYLREQRTLCG